MTFRTLATPAPSLCPVGSVLTVEEVAQLTEQNAERIYSFAFMASECSYEPGFRFKPILNEEETHQLDQIIEDAEHGKREAERD